MFLNRTKGRAHPSSWRWIGCIGAALCVAVVSAMGLEAVHAADAPIALVADSYDPSSGIEISQRENQIHVAWPIDQGRQARLVFDLQPDGPLFHSISVSERPGGPASIIASGLDPVLLLRVGDRELDERRGWTVFFDRM